MSAANATLNAPPVRKPGKNAFFFIIVTVFIDMMAFAVIMPSMPYLVAELLNGKDAVLQAKAMAAAGNLKPLETMLSDAAPWGGYITTVYAVMNFLVAPILGGLSDRFGRRPILLVSMGMLAIDFVIMGMAHTVWLLFLGRILSGISGATHSTAAAYIADVTEPKARGQAFGMLGMAFGLGFILGPAIGGYLGQFDPRLPFFASAALAAINFCYGLFVLPESLAHEHRRRFDWKRANAFGTFKHLMQVPYLAWFMLALGLFNVAHWVYPATFNYFAGVAFGWNEGMIGLALVAVGVGSAIVQGGLTGPLIKRFGPTRMAVFGFVICAITFAAYSMATEGWMMFVIIPFGAPRRRARPVDQPDHVGAHAKECAGRTSGRNRERAVADQHLRAAHADAGVPLLHLASGADLLPRRSVCARRLRLHYLADPADARPQDSTEARRTAARSGWRDTAGRCARRHAGCSDGLT